MRPNVATTVVTYALLSLAGIAAFMMPSSIPASDAAPPEQPKRASVTLRGHLRDFRSDHPDFGHEALGTGHHVQLVDPELGRNRRPALSGAGRQVLSQWRDRESNPIMPAADALLDGPINAEIMIPSDSTTVLDVAGDARLLWERVTGRSGAQRLRLVIRDDRPDGRGTYRFSAGELVTGETQSGFSTTFEVADFSELLVTLSPSARPAAHQLDTAFHLTAYDVATDAIVYEARVGAGSGLVSAGADLAAHPENVDACGAALDDSEGMLGNPGMGGIRGAETFDQWFRDVLGTNMSRLYSVRLELGDDDVYEFATRAFYPLDGKLMGNEDAAHNGFFTYAFAATFTYDECGGQFFEFAGNDDAWIYIDDRLALDLGGTATESRQRILLDRLDLEDGAEYSFDFFGAHRRTAEDSLFKMRTNMKLATKQGRTPMTMRIFD